MPTRDGYGDSPTVYERLAIPQRYNERLAFRLFTFDSCPTRP